MQNVVSYGNNCSKDINAFHGSKKTKNMQSNAQ